MRLRKWVVSLAGIQNILSLMKVFDCGCLFVGMDSREVISFLVDKSNWPEREGKSRQTRWIAKTGYFKLRDTASFLFGVELFTRIAK